MSRQLLAHEIAEALGAKPAGRGKWKVRCIAHEERTPSLYITEAGDRTLLKCWGGCTQAAVISALQDRGLWSAPIGGAPIRHAPRPKKPDSRELQWILDDIHLLDARPGELQVWTFLRHAAEMSPHGLECVSRALRKHRPASRRAVRAWMNEYMRPQTAPQEQAA